MQEQNSEEQEVIPSDMLAVSYDNEWSSNSKVEKRRQQVMIQKVEKKANPTQQLT